MKTTLRIFTILFVLALFITGCSSGSRPEPTEPPTDPSAPAGEGEQLEVVATEPKDEKPSEKPSEPSESTEETEAPTTDPTEEIEPSEATQSVTGATEKPTQKPTSKPTSGSSSGSQPEPTEPPATSSSAKPTAEPTEAPTEPTEPPKVVYDIDAAMSAGNSYALQIGFGSIEYGFSPAAGNCGYYPAEVIYGKEITNLGGQEYLVRLAKDNMAATKNQLVALLVNMDGRPAEDIKYYRVRSYITYDEAADKYKIYALYG